MRIGAIILSIILLGSSGLHASDGIELHKNLKGVQLSGLYYLSYQAGQSSQGTVDYNKFAVKRAYFTLKKELNSFINSRITLDAHQDDSGDMKVRIKYVYADIKLPEFGFIINPHVEFGLVHTPWLDFEEHVNYYRMQDTMFMERVGIFNSGDFGFTLMGYLGGVMDDEYQNFVNKKYPGRYGSFAFGIYNGGGYHAAENNQDKIFQGRLTIRPLPDIIPGLQISELYIFGKGNGSGTQDEINDWQTLAGMVSYEHRYIVLTGQYVMGYGNKSGSWSDDADYSGYSAFAEGKLDQHWRVIGRYDHFDPDTELDNDGYNRFIGGIGYDFGHRNILIVDYDVVTYEADGANADPRLQVTFQIHF